MGKQLNVQPHILTTIDDAVIAIDSNEIVTFLVQARNAFTASKPPQLWASPSPPFTNTNS